MYDDPRDPNYEDASGSSDTDNDSVLSDASYVSEAHESHESHESGPPASGHAKLGTVASDAPGEVAQPGNERHAARKQPNGAKFGFVEAFRHLGEVWGEAAPPELSALCLSRNLYAVMDNGTGQFLDKSNKVDFHVSCARDMGMLGDLLAWLGAGNGVTVTAFFDSLRCWWKALKKRSAKRSSETTETLGKMSPSEQLESNLKMATRARSSLPGVDFRLAVNAEAETAVIACTRQLLSAEERAVVFVIINDRDMFFLSYMYV